MNRDMSGSVRGLIDEMLSGSVAGNVKVETSGGSTVTITPTLESGTKIADFTIDDNSGVLYAPTPEPPIEYTAGANIQISKENVISATDTTYTAGNNITIENGVISASGGSSINYSTTEQVIGTWIDGKPLYRRVLPVEVTLSGNTWTQVSDLDALNMDNCISITALNNNRNTTSSLQIDSSSSEVFYMRPSGSFTTSHFILEYTKTTDQV